MKQYIHAGLASAALVAAAIFSTPATAADLGSWGGSMKDGPMPVQAQERCYLGVAAGYSWSDDPEIGYANTLGVTFEQRIFDDAWLVEFAAGCSLGHGVRGEVAYTRRGDKDLTVIPRPSLPDDPIYTSVQSDSVMFNLYYDFGDFSGFTPYVGGGIGFANHKVENAIFENAGPLGDNPQFGDENTEFAWALMAGVSKRMSENVSLDLGYRYIDMGDTATGRRDNQGFMNPPVEIDDLTAHEIKIGLRYDVDSLF